MDTTIESTLSRLHLQLSTAEQDRIRRELEEGINFMITHRFEALVQALYRIDVDERKIKTMLQQHLSTDAARIIATLIIERQLQKLRIRGQFGANPGIPEEDAW